MKSLFLALAACALLAACASEPEAPQASERVDCRNVDPPTGSNHIRRRNCYAAAPDSEQAREAARDLQGLQQQITPSLLK
jgi:hypothetical protein